MSGMWGIMPALDLETEKRRFGVRFSGMHGLLPVLKPLLDARETARVAREAVSGAGMWGLLPALKATPEQKLRAEREALRLSAKAEMARLNAELKALRTSNEGARARVRMTKAEAEASRQNHAMARKRMAIAAAKERAAKLQEQESKAARLAARVVELNAGKSRAVAPKAVAVVQTRLAASVQTIAERWQPRPADKYRNF